jgi:Lysozyme like domain
MPHSKMRARNLNLALPAARRRVPLSQALRGVARGLAGLGQALGTLSPAQIQGYAANAGFTGDDLATAVAIAMAESTGNPNAYNAETAAAGGTPPGQGSYGLWQIYLKAHPEFAGQNLYDPQTNANAAYSVYQAAGGFSPWSTYNSLAYVMYLSPLAATPAVVDASAPLTIDASTGLPVSDSTPTPGNSIGGMDTNTLLLWTGVAAGVYFLADVLSDL